MRLCRTNIIEGDIWQLSIEGPCLNAACVEFMRTTTQSAISMNARGVIIDVQLVERLDPLGLAGLTSLSKEFTSRTHIVLAGLRGHMQELALILHLHEIFDIYEETHAAVVDMNADDESLRGRENAAHD